MKHDVISYSEEVSLNIAMLSASPESVISQAIEKQKEQEQAIIDSAKAAREESDAISELYAEFRKISKEYETNASKKSDLISVTDTLLEKLGYEKKTIPELNDYVKQSADGFYIEADALGAVLKKTYETRNAFVDNEKIKTEQAISEAKSRIQVWQIELNILEKVGELETDRAKELQGYIDSATSDMELMSNYLIYLDSLKNNIYTSNNPSGAGKNTISAELQQQIDYYNTIIKAIEAVTDKRIESIDSEIEALNKQKKALEDQNDERQRELDLIEARNNLDKAKKRTVFVFDKDKGFVETVDKKAIDEAQQKYDEAITEEKIAKIDKLIAEREAEKEKWSEYKKGYSNISDEIKSGIAIEQTTKALGTDTKGLLKLSEQNRQDIIKGLAEATLKKDYEDNKDNAKYTKVTLDDVLKHLGASVTADEFRSMWKNMNNTQIDRTAVDSYSERKSEAINTYNNPTTINSTFNISGATDPQETANVVNEQLNRFLTQFVNRQKQ